MLSKNAAYPCAIKAMKRAGELWRFSKLRQSKYLNNLVEQDHRRFKRLVRPGLGFASFSTARRTIAGYEIMAMVGKGASSISAPILYRRSVPRRQLWSSISRPRS
jgi:IS6 family transposase